MAQIQEHFSASISFQNWPKLPWIHFTALCYTMVLFPQILQMALQHAQSHQ